MRIVWCGIFQSVVDPLCEYKHWTSWFTWGHCAQQKDVETVVFCVYEANPENAGQVIQLNKKSEVQIQSFIIWIFVLWVF